MTAQAPPPPSEPNPFAEPSADATLQTAGLSDDDRTVLRRARHEQRLREQQERVRQSQPRASAAEPWPAQDIDDQPDTVPQAHEEDASIQAEPGGGSAHVAQGEHGFPQHQQSMRAMPVWRRPRPSVPVLLGALAVHVLLLWLLAHYGPKLPIFSSASGDGAGGTPAFSFSFRPVATLHLIDESAQRLEGSPSALKAARTKLEVPSSNPTLIVERSVTTTIPQLTPDRDPSDGAAIPATVLRPSLELAAVPLATPDVPTSPKAAPLAPTPSARVLDGSSLKSTSEPAALPRPALAATAAIADESVQPAPIIAALPPPPKPDPVRRNLTTNTPQSPAALDALRPLAPSSQPQAVQPLSLQINLPVANLPPAVTVAPSPVAALEVNSATSAPTIVPSVPSNAVQVIVNVPLASGQGSPSGLPSTLNVPATGIGAGGPATGSGSGAVVGTAGGPGSGGGAGGTGAVGGTTAGSAAGGAQAGAGSGGAARPAAASASGPRGLNMQLPGVPYSPQRQRSLADLANEQLRRGMATTQLERGVGTAAKQDCVSAERAGASAPKSGATGLLALPFLAWDAATGKCK